MAHSYTSILLHCIFSTKERKRFILPELQVRLFAYMGGIARKNKFRLIAAGGIEDHVHLLISLSKTLDVAHAMQLIKGGSSKWIHDEFPELAAFAWQEGYGAFSIGISDVDRTVEYIKNQAEHHKGRDFKDEFTAFLDKHFIEYDPKYVFD